MDSLQVVWYVVCFLTGSGTTLLAVMLAFKIALRMRGEDPGLFDTTSPVSDTAGETQEGDL